MMTKTVTIERYMVKDSYRRQWGDCRLNYLQEHNCPMKEVYFQAGAQMFEVPENLEGAEILGYLERNNEIKADMGEIYKVSGDSFYTDYVGFKKVVF